MYRTTTAIVSCSLLVLLVRGSETQAAEAETPVRGVLVGLERVTPAFLATWKANGATSIVVRLDEGSRPRWGAMARDVEKAGMTLWPWVEVGRNPVMADAHPEWMATIGGHHADWRSRFPKAPASRAGEVIKAWPWVPIGYAAAFDAHRDRLQRLLTDLPGSWSGVFLNDLQAGPSSCGCGNDQCRWALDYGSPATTARRPGEDSAAKFVAELSGRHPNKVIVPVWVTECEAGDLPDARLGTKLCGSVACATGTCWPAYAGQWNPLLKATSGPIAVGLWSEAFRRDPASWNETALALFQGPPRGATPLDTAKTIAVLQAWGMPEASQKALANRVKTPSGWVLAIDAIDQSWEPRAVPVLR